jgi:ABC-type Fe3+ transport system permease subunit
MNKNPPTSIPTRRARQRTVLPGFGLSAAITSLMIVGLVVIPLAVLILRAASLGPAGFLAAAWTPRARAAYAVSLGASLAAAIISSLLGLLVAFWFLFRTAGNRLKNCRHNHSQKPDDDGAMAHQSTRAGVSVRNRQGNCAIEVIQNRWAA